jgi:hypothetical protein
MFLQPPPIILRSLAAQPYHCSDEDADGGTVAESTPQYRPRHPECSAFYQLFETCFDSYVHGYEERFESRSGPFAAILANCST